MKSCVNVRKERGGGIGSGVKAKKKWVQEGKRKKEKWNKNHEMNVRFEERKKERKKEGKKELILKEKRTLKINKERKKERIDFKGKMNFKKKERKNWFQMLKERKKKERKKWTWKEEC